MSKLLTLFLFAALFLLTGCWSSGDAKDTKSRSDAFAEVLGFAAPASVVEIKSHWYFLRDAYIRWLRFSCDEPTLSKIRGLKGAKTSAIQPVPAAPGNSAPDRNPNAPDWWTKAVVSPQGLDMLEIDAGRTNEADVVHIWIDKKTRTVYATRSVWH